MHTFNHMGHCLARDIQHMFDVQEVGSLDSTAEESQSVKTGQSLKAKP